MLKWPFSASDWRPGCPSTAMPGASFAACALIARSIAASSASAAIDGADALADGAALADALATGALAEPLAIGAPPSAPGPIADHAPASAPGAPASGAAVGVTGGFGFFAEHA